MSEAARKQSNLEEIMNHLTRIWFFSRLLASQNEIRRPTRKRIDRRKQMTTLVGEIIERFEIEVLNEENKEELLQFLLSQYFNLRSPRLYWQIFHYIDTKCRVLIPLKDFKSYLSEKGFKQPRKGARLRALQQIRDHFGPPQSVQASMLIYFQKFYREYQIEIPSFQDEGEKLIHRFNWNGNPRALTGGLILFLLESFNIGENIYLRTPFPRTIAEAVGSNRRTIREWCQRIYGYRREFYRSKRRVGIIK